MMTWSRPLTTYPASGDALEDAVLGDLYRGDRHIASLTGSEKW